MLLLQAIMNEMRFASYIEIGARIINTNANMQETPSMIEKIRGSIQRQCNTLRMFENVYLLVMVQLYFA